MKPTPDNPEAPHLTERLDAAVLDARQLGLSWEKIGTAVGISYPAARERCGTTHARSVVGS